MARRRRRPAKKHVQLLNTARPFYDEMLRLQGGGCAICARKPSDKRRLDIDHDHPNMFVRGLLCPRCNRALPSWITPSWLRGAAAYLERGRILWLEEAIASGMLQEGETKITDQEDCP